MTIARIVTHTAYCVALVVCGCNGQALDRTSVPTSPILTTVATATISSLDSPVGECILPCIFGITPGKTRWDQARLILSKATSLKPTPYTNDQWRNGEMIYHYRIQDNLASIDMRVLQDLVVEITYEADLPNTHIPLRLQAPAPTKAWLATYSSQKDGLLPFLLYLQYNEARIFMVSGVEGQIINDEIVGCFKKSVLDWSVTGWAQSENQAALARIEHDRLDLDPRFPVRTKPLHEVSDFLLSAIRPSIGDSPTDFCIHTKQRLWASP